MHEPALSYDWVEPSPASPGKTLHVNSDVSRQFSAYAVVGVVGTLLDVGLFATFLRLGLSTWVAVTLAFFLATAMQFFFNRQWSFRAFHRPAIVQAPVYVILTIVNWLVALAIVEIGVATFHLDPLVAKAASIPPTAIAGFVGNRYLTFGPGLRKTISAITQRRRKQ